MNQNGKTEDKGLFKRLDRKRKIALLVLASVTLAVLLYGGWMIKRRMDYAITNAVFVDTEDITNLGFKRVAGRLIKLTKREGDSVKKGELLAEIDPTDYGLAVEALEKELEATKKERDRLQITLSRVSQQTELKVHMAKDSVKAIEEEIDALKANISALSADIAQLKRDRDRFKELFKEKAVARRRFELIDTQLKAKRQQRSALVKKMEALKAKLSSSKRGVEMAVADKKRVGETEAAIATLSEKIKALDTKLKDARLNLEYCKLRSPIDGKVAKKYASRGDVVAPGRPVYALVDPKDIYILVLLEETKLRGVVPGSPAKIRIDALPDEEYQGVVDKILPTSAAKFALVPRDISAGEFTKVVQRMQVKVRITKGDVSKLVIGMGGEIEIKRKR